MSVSMVPQVASGDDLLLSSFDTVCFTQHHRQEGDRSKDTSEPDTFDSIGADLPGQRSDAGKCSNQFDYSDSACIDWESTERDGEAKVIVENEENCNPTDHLIVYTSSRKSAHKLDLKNDPKNPPRNFKRAANKKASVNFTSLQISRGRRSLLSKRVRSSIWGFSGKSLPDFIGKNGDLKLYSDSKPRRARGVQGIMHTPSNQTSHKSIGKPFTPTGRISLKIKIGNFDLCNITKKFNASEYVSDEVPRDMILPHAGNMPDVISYDASVLNVKFDNSSSDPGTSPDSEVINSASDDPLFGSVLPNRQGSSNMSNAFVSVADASPLTLRNNESKKGKKKRKMHQAGKHSIGINTADTENTDNPEVPATLGLRLTAENLSSCDEASIDTIIKPYFSEANVSSEFVANGFSSKQSQDTLLPCSNGKKSSNCSRANRQGKSRSKISNMPCKGHKSSKKAGNHSNPGGNPKVSKTLDASCVLNELESDLTAGNSLSADHEERRALDEDARGQINNFHLSVGALKEKYIPMRNAWVLCDACEKWRRIPATLADRIEETNCGWTCKDNTDKYFADCSVPQEKSNTEINDELEISDAEEDGRDASLKSVMNQSKDSQQSSWSLIKSNLFLHRSRKAQTMDEVMVCHCKPPTDGRMGCGAKCLNRMLNIECVEGTCPCGELCSNQQFQRRKYAKLKWFRCGRKGHGLQALDDISEGQFLIEYVGEVLDVHVYEARQREYALNGHKHFYFMTLNGSEVIDACMKGNLGRFINHSCDPNCRTEKWMVNGEVCVGLFAVKDIKKGEEVTFDYNYVRVFGAAAKRCVCGSHNCRGYIGGDPSNSEVIVQGDSDDECSEPLMICEDREMNDDWNDIISSSLSERVDEITNESSVNMHKMNKLEYDAVPLEITAEELAEEALTQNIVAVSLAPPECLETSASRIVQQKLTVDSSAGIDSAADSRGNLNMNKESGEPLNRCGSPAYEVESEGTLSEMQCSVQFKNISLQSDSKKIPIDPVEGSFVQKSVENPSASACESEMATVSRRKSHPNTLKSKSKLKYAYVGHKKELSKSSLLLKTHDLPISIKKGKVKNVVSHIGTSDVGKPIVASHNSENLPELFSNGHFEAVEKKLNELLDPEGGISKRKDASRGYLKLLFLTAASGSNGHGEAIQSNRDLSMILGALLKTKSRTVLMDIINKNGVQMLHNIIKRCRREFIKTPILRKLLKIIDYLATRDILKLEHITGGPPRPGVESFKDSILALTEHSDKQIHQSARSFRDRWIPRSLRKSCCTERDDLRMELPQRTNFGRLSLLQDHRSDLGGRTSEVMGSCELQSVASSNTVEISSLKASSFSDSNGANITKTRKRKSRWDNPAEDHPHPSIRFDSEGARKLNMDDDIPPGFSSPCNGPMIPPGMTSTAFKNKDKDSCIRHPTDIAAGESQQRFIASMFLAHGIPSSIMQQFGVLAATSEVWTIAPGVPFHPFPPLPPYARNTGEQLPLAASSEPQEKTTYGKDKFFAHHSGQKHARTPDVEPPEMNVSSANDRPDFQQGNSYNMARTPGMEPPEINALGASDRPDFQRGNSYNMGRKFLRQQKWNHSKLNPPPWVRMRNGW